MELSSAIVLNVSNPAKAQNSTINNNQQAIIINKNEKILALLRTNLDTKTTKKGDPISAVLMDDVIVGQKIVIPKNSVLAGQVLKVFKPMKASRDAAITFGIYQIQTPQGQGRHRGDGSDQRRTDPAERLAREIDGDPHSSQCPGNSIYDSHGCGHVSLAGSCKSGNVTIINGSYYCDQNELQFCKDGNLTTVIDCHSCKHYWSGGVDSTICWDEDPDTEDTQRLSSQSGPGCYFASSRECSP